MIEKPTYEKQKQVEKALRESEERYRHLVEFSSDIVWSIDINGVHTFANKAIEKILGYGVNESIGSYSFQFMHPDDKDCIQKKFQESVEQKKGWSELVIRWMHKNGSIKYFESSAQPVFDIDNNLIGFNGIDRDITERKHAEEGRERLLEAYRKALENIKTLRGLLPICTRCKKIRDDKGYWNRIEAYIQEHSEAEFTHGLCPECSDKLYGKEDWYSKVKERRLKSNPLSEDNS